MTSQEKLDYAQSLPDLVAEYGRESAPGFNQGFYLGSRDQARLHKWYFIGGAVIGGVLGWLL